MIVAENGKVVMDTIRRIVAKMRETERVLLAARTARVSVDERNIVIVVFLGAALSIVTRLAIAFLVQRWPTRQTQA